MKRYCLCLAFLLPSSLSAQHWFSSGPAQGQQITALGTAPNHPHVLYAGTARNGLFKTLDTGQQWQPLELPGHTGRSTFIQAILVDPHHPGTVYIVAGAEASNTVFKSIDGGQTWQTLDLGLPQDTAVRLVRADPLAPGVLFATHDNGLSRSMDNGAHWTASGHGLPDEHIVTLAFDPVHADILYAALGNCSCNSMLFKSLDGGETWTNLSAYFQANNLLILTITPSPHNTRILYAGTTGGLYKSTDAGTHWSLVNLADGWIGHVVVDPHSAHTLYAASGPKSLLGAGVFRSINGGETWHPLQRGGHPSALLLTDDRLYAGLWINANEYGVYRLDLETALTAVETIGWGHLKATFTPVADP